MKRTVKLIGAALLGAACSGTVFAGHQVFNFDNDPGSDPALSQALILGTHNYYSATGEQIWSSGAGVGINGNPKTGGYLSLCDATNGNNNLVFVFPDVDSGLPVKAFQIDMDMRVGNPHAANGRPADGFSISFARNGDIALQNATNGIVGGFAGGDSSIANAQNPLGSTDVENGTKTGVAVVFDAWQGNWLPDTQPINNTGGSNDREGIAVRVDDHTLVQLNLQNNRNEKDCIPSPQTGLSNDAKGLSEQTGTNALVTANFLTCTATYGNSESSGSFTNLFWQHLMVRLTNISSVATIVTNNLTVSWKGVTVVNTNLAVFSPTVGRLVLAGRCGGNNQNVHIDNLVVDTTVSTNAYLVDVQGGLTSFTFHLSDNGASTVTSVSSVLLDGTDVTAQTPTTYSAPITTGAYSQAARFAPGSVHTVSVTFVDSFSVTQTAEGLFAVPNYAAFPTNYVLPLSAVDQTKPGFYVSPYQSREADPNAIWWADEQVMGYHGTNAVGAGTVSQENGFDVWSGPLGFYNPSGRAVSATFFANDADLTSFGIGANYPQDTQYGAARYDIYDNSALEFFGYIYFPTSGVYNMVVGTDDNFQLSVSQNPQDRMGQVLWTSSGARVPTSASPPLVGADIHQIIIDQAGVYPIRLVYENGGGGAALEWYTITPPVGSPGFDTFLVNDNNTVNQSGGIVLKTFRALNGTVDVGPYITKADPVRGDFDVVYYQPVTVDLANGTGSKTVNQSTIALSVDGAPQTVTTTATGNGFHVAQTLTGFWSSGSHTNLLTFADNLGTNYTYTWTFNVLGGVLGVASADSTNSTAIISIPASAGVSASAVDSSKPGFRVRSYQTPMEAGQGHSGFTEAELLGEHGFNVADQTGTGGTGYFTWNNLVDFRYSSGNGAQGEWTYDLGDFTGFGVGAIAPAYRFNNTPSDTLTEESAIEYASWLVFNQPGNYIMFVNTDDGFRVMVPQGTPGGKLGTYIFAADVGRGMAGPNSFAQTGGSYFQFNIPTAGAYPFRLLYYNGGGDGGIEWSVYQRRADGSVLKMAVNDPNKADGVKAYQALTTGEPTAPYVQRLDPVYNEPDVNFWEPTVVDLADGATGKTVDATSIQLTSDGLAQTITTSHPSAGVTRVAQQLTEGFFWSNGAHTNVLTYKDTLGNSYTNIWPFTAVGPGLSIVQVPASQRVDPSLVDQTQPGFRVKSYQTTATNSGPNIAFAEAQFLGMWGPNIADQSFTNGPGFFVWPYQMDFVENVGANGSNGEYRYNWGMNTNFGFQLQGGGNAVNYNTMIFAGWMNFPKAGLYGMTVNSDDGFKVTTPLGGNPFSEAGIILGFADGGRGNTTGGAANPFRGSVTPFVFNIPQAGAYPIRLLWYNGTGGLSVEWTLIQPMSDGSVERVIVGDPNVPDAVKVYQTLQTVPPEVLAVTASIGSGNPPTNGLNNAQSGQPGLTLGGTGTTQTVPNSQDVWVFLQDGNTTTINPTSAILSFNGATQPITVTNGNGITALLRSATNGYWPSGSYGPLMVYYQDNTSAWHTNFVAYMETPFGGATLHVGGVAESKLDTTKPGFKVRTYQVDPAIDDRGVNEGAVTTGGLTIPNRVPISEQLLAGIWGPNQANLGPATYPGPVTNAGAIDNGYFDLTGGGPSNGVVNLNAQYPANAGDFQASGGFPDQPMPGLPGLGPTTQNNDRSNSVALEILAYVDFPTNGTYTLGVSSDDGFRLLQGWDTPTNNGALLVNSPSGVAGFKAAAMNSCEQPVSSQPVTNFITGDLVMPDGIGFGSVSNGEGCVLFNPSQLVGKIALMYRSANCGALQQVQNAALAGAQAVVLIQKHRPTTDGLLAEELGVSPMQPIPMVMIEETDGNALVAAMQTNTVNVTITPSYDMLNPTDDRVLGQTSAGKGNSDCNFQVTVTNAPQAYPLRLVYWNGGGGVNVEFYSLTGTNGTRKLVNDLSNPSSGLGLAAYYSLVSTTPQLSIRSDGVNLTITYTGTLQTTTDLSTKPVVWTPDSSPSPVVIPISSTTGNVFFRSVQ